MGVLDIIFLDGLAFPVNGLTKGGCFCANGLGKGHNLMKLS